MAARIARQKSSLSNLISAASLRSSTRGRLDLEFSQASEAAARRDFGSQFETAETILNSSSASSDMYPARLPGEFLPPELSDRGAISATNVAEAWAQIASYQSIFATPNEFLSRVSGLSLDTIARLVRAQCPALDHDAATAVASRLLSQLSQRKQTCIGSGVEPTRARAAAAETNRQVTAQVTHRAPKDYHAVWEGGDPSAMEDLADVLARAESSKHVAVVDALTRLAATDGMPCPGEGVQAHHLLRIRVRARAVPAWAYDHTLLDQFDVLYWILEPFIEGMKFFEGKEHTLVPPIVPPVSTDEFGGTTQIGFSDTTEVAVYMRKAETVGSGQFYIDGEPYTNSRWVARQHDKERFALPFALLGINVDDFDIWAETHNASSAQRLGEALNHALARGLAAIEPRHRPALRWNNYLAPNEVTSTGSRPGFYGWKRVRTVKKR